MTATGHLFEDMTATYHPPGVAGGWQARSSNVQFQWASRQLWKKNGVEHFKGDLSSVFMAVGDANTPKHPQLFSATTFESQCLTEDGDMLHTSDGRRHSDVRIGEPLDPVLRFSSRSLPNAAYLADRRRGFRRDRRGTTPLTKCR